MDGIRIRVTRDKSKAASKHGLKKYVHEELKTLWRDCVRAFIQEAIKHVDVDTGMSEASFYDLATNVRVANQVIADIMGKGPSRPHVTYTTIKGIPQPGVKKSIPLGKSLGNRNKKAYKLLFGQPNQPNMVFEFNIVVYQYKLFEAGFTDRHGNSQGPWNSLEYGRLAFIETWKANFARRVTPKKLLGFLLPK